jgi:anti-sigma B factor antagonist
MMGNGRDGSLQMVAWQASNTWFIEGVMDTKLSEENGITILEPSGEIDLHTSPQLREKLQALLKARTPRLIVDLGAVNYMDSSALATLIEYLRDAAAHSGQLALCRLQPRVRTVFELVRLNELFSIFNTREEAISSLSPV